MTPFKHWLASMWQENMRKYLWMQTYSQWFVGKQNNVMDALSWEWQRTNKKLTSILCYLFPSQMPDHFKILPIPSKISCWLISLLQQLPVSKRLREEHTTAKLKHGKDGQHTASTLDAQTFSWINSRKMSEFPCSAHLQWLSEKDNSCGIVPSHMWCRPSGQREDRTPQKMMTENLVSFYQDSIKLTRTNNPQQVQQKALPFILLKN